MGKSSEGGDIVIHTLFYHALYLLAQAQDAGVPTTDATPTRPDSLTPMLIIFGSFAVLFYFIIMRPQRSEQKKRDEMLNQVSRGDSVVTIGGIHGTVEGVDLNKGIVSLSVAPKITIRVNKSAVSSITPKGKDKDKKGEEKAEEAKAK